MLCFASFSLGIRKDESKHHVEDCATVCIFLKSHTMSNRLLYTPAKNDDDADYFLWSWSQRIRKQRWHCQVTVGFLSQWKRLLKAILFLKRQRKKSEIIQHSYLRALMMRMIGRLMMTLASIRFFVSTEGGRYRVLLSVTAAASSHNLLPALYAEFGGEDNCYQYCLIIVGVLELISQRVRVYHTAGWHYCKVYFITRRNSQRCWERCLSVGYCAAAAAAA